MLWSLSVVELGSDTRSSQNRNRIIVLLQSPSVTFCTTSCIVHSIYGMLHRVPLARCGLFERKIIEPFVLGMESFNRRVELVRW